MAILKKTKQLFAALLCLCMVAAILPAGIPAAKAAEAKTYDLFNLTGVTSGSLISAITTANTNGQWEYHSQSNDGEVTKWNTTYGLSYSYFSKGRWTAFTLKDIKAGIYDVKMDHLKYASGGVSEFYLLPYSTTVDISDCNYSTLIGDVDFYVSSGEYTEEGDPVGTATVPSDGDYILVIKSNGKSPENEGFQDFGHYAVWGKKIVMTPAADGIYAKLEANSVAEGNSTGINITVSDNGAVVTDGYNVSFTDPTVASYASGRINALKPGSTDIVVSYGSYESATIPFTVAELNRDSVISIKGLGYKDSPWKYLKDLTREETGNWAVHSSNTFYGLENGKLTYPVSWSNETITLYDITWSRDRYAAFSLFDVFAGDYDVTVDIIPGRGQGIVEFYLLPDNGEAIDLSTMCTKENWLGNVSAWADQEYDYENPVTVNLKDVTIDEAGDYILIIRGTGKTLGTTYSMFMSEFKLDWQGAPTSPENGDAAFSDVYAYVRRDLTKDDKTYTVTLVGGINTDDLADYNNVGFNIVSETLGYEDTKTDTAVFKKLTLSDGELTAEQFGSDYIFVQTFNLTVGDEFGAYSFLTFKAVAETAEGGTIYGDEYTIQIAK